MKKIFFFICLSYIFVNNSSIAQKAIKTPTPVIFDTDMGSDIDDALALDILYKYVDMGKIDLLAIMTNKDGIGSPRYIDIMNTWYGYPNIPIGVAKDPCISGAADNYTNRIYDDKNSDGTIRFKRTVQDATKLPTPEELYRKILAKQSDNSVEIIATGLFTNLGRLLDTKPDKYSPLTGKELVAKKVKSLTVAACNFDGRLIGENNVSMDKPNAIKTFNEWPGIIYASPYEIGLQVFYPVVSRKRDFTWTKNHPVMDGWRKHADSDLCTWDLIAVLAVVEPGRFMNLSERGNIFMNKLAHTYFTPSIDGKHYYYTATPEQRQQMEKYFLEIIPRKPKFFKE